MATRKSKSPAVSRRRDEEPDPPPTAAERRALARSIKDSEDRTRYLLASTTLPGISLYYMLQDDVWSFDDPSLATLFKRRTAAAAIKALLRPDVHVVPCKVDDDGQLLLNSLARRKVGGQRLALLPSWRRRKTSRRSA